MAARTEAATITSSGLNLLPSKREGLFSSVATTAAATVNPCSLHGIVLLRGLVGAHAAE